MKRFFTKTGIWLLAAAATIAVMLCVVSALSSGTGLLHNALGVIASPFRAAGSAVAGWVGGISQRFEDVETLQQENDELRQQIAELEEQTNEQERSIEALCLKLLLQQQPVARDLRQISAALKMITDMERIGDQAADIAEIIPFFLSHNTFDCTLVCRMAQQASSMVTQSVDAFVRRDVDLARSIAKQDDLVDEDFSNVKQALISAIAREPGQGEVALDLLMIAKYFERIGDHAVNLSEWVEFSVTGVHKHDGVEYE